MGKNERMKERLSEWRPDEACFWQDGRTAAVPSPAALHVTLETLLGFGPFSNRNDPHLFILHHGVSSLCDGGETL